jgi:hypothetical protein
MGAVRILIQGEWNGFEFTDLAREWSNTVRSRQQDIVSRARANSL